MKLLVTTLIVSSGRLAAMSGSESVQDLFSSGRREKGMSSSWDVDSPRVTPPGTPPPPYRGGSLGASCDLNSPADEDKNGAVEEVGLNSQIITFYAM